MFSSNFHIDNPKIHSRERGAVLFIGLIFLFLMSLIAVTISRTSVLQERMTGGLRNDQLATMGADSALREGEQRLWRAPVDPSRPFLACNVSATLGCYSFAPGAPIAAVTNFRDPTKKLEDPSLTGVGTPYGTAALDNAAQGTAKLASRPRYIIEDLGIDGTTGPLQVGENDNLSSPTSKHLYRVTARSSGGSSSTQRVLESTFASIKGK